MSAHQTEIECVIEICRRRHCCCVVRSILVMVDQSITCTLLNHSNHEVALLSNDKLKI